MNLLKSTSQDGKQKNIWRIKLKNLRHETKLNTITSDEKFAYLTHKITGAVLKFDLNENVISALINSMNAHGNYHYVKSKQEFLLHRNDSTKVYSAKHLIFAELNNIPIEIAKHYYVTTINGDKLDCTAGNLKGHPPFEVKQSDTHILILNGTAEPQKISYYPELFDIISSLKWHRKNKNYLSTEIKGADVRLSHLCYVFYHTKGCDIGNYETHVFKFKERIERENLTVDHKLNRNDNTVENLELLPRPLNSKKFNHAENMQPHQFYKPLKNGECAGRHEYPRDVCAQIYKKVFKETPYDLALLPQKNKSQETRIENLVNLAKRDELPADAIRIKTSRIFYVYGGLKLLGKLVNKLNTNLKEAIGEKNYEQRINEFKRTC